MEDNVQKVVFNSADYTVVCVHVYECLCPNSENDST